MDKRRPSDQYVRILLGGETEAATGPGDLVDHDTQTRGLSILVRLSSSVRQHAVAMCHGSIPADRAVIALFARRRANLCDNGSTDGVAGKNPCAHLPQLPLNVSSSFSNCARAALRAE